MKALTIRQPWASLVIRGQKVEEYRTRPTSFRGTLAIHSGRHLCDWNDCQALLAFWHTELSIEPSWDEAWNWITSQLRGHILGTVQVVGCRALGPEEPGRQWGTYAWLLADPHEWDKPKRAIGQLGIWDWDGADLHREPRLWAS